MREGSHTGCETAADTSRGAKFLLLTLSPFALVAVHASNLPNFGSANLSRTSRPIARDLAPEVVRITPGSTKPTTAQSITFRVEFSEPVVGFNDLDDLLLTHDQTTSTGATITGSGSLYSVVLNGIDGVGSLTLAINSSSDIVDGAGQPLASSATRSVVLTGTPYEAWAFSRDLAMGFDDLFTDDPDSDGSWNITEFALNGDPLEPADPPKTRATVERLGGEDYSTLTFPARVGATFTGTSPSSASAAIDGIVYVLASSRKRVAFEEDELVEVIPARAAGLPDLDTGWTYRTFRLAKPVTAEPGGFLRLSILPATP